MGFGPRQSDITAIKEKTDNLPSDPASEADVETAITAAHAVTDAAVGVVQAKTDNLPSDPADESLLEAAIATRAAESGGQLDRKYPFMDFWSAPEDKLTVTDTAGNISFPNIVVSGLPSGLTIRRVVLIMTCRALEEDSGSDNYVNAASKTIRVKVSTGAWLGESIVAITFAQNSLYCKASSKEAGPVIVGDADIKSVVTGNGTYNVMSNHDDTADAVVVLAASMYLYDVQVGLRVFYS